MRSVCEIVNQLIIIIVLLLVHYHDKISLANILMWDNVAKIAKFIVTNEMSCIISIYYICIHMYISFN